MSAGTELAVLEVDADTAAAAGPDAVRKARLRGGISRPALALTSYCALRPRLLGDAWRGELSRMGDALGGAPHLGFFSAGQYALSDDGVAEHAKAAIATVVIGQDLTFAAQATRELDLLRRGAREELERVVDARTAELRATNERLASEVEQRRGAEAVARRHERAIRTLGACNEALVRASDERRLLEDVCRIIVEVGGYLLAWVGFAEDDERRTVRPVAKWGMDEGYVASADVVWSDTPRGRGPVGTAIRTGRPAFARRICDDPAFATWRAQAQRRGFAAMIALPLQSKGAPLGALAIYSADSDSLADERELKLLAELAEDLAFGIHVLRERTDHARMQARLAEADRLAAVGTLAAGVAHEINNPLAYLLGGVDHVERELAALPGGLAGALDEVRTVLGEMRTGGERIRHIVRDLKTFSRPDQDERGDVDLRTLAEASLHMAAPQMCSRARVVRELGPVPIVHANEASLGQVLLNLLVNAAQAIPEGRAGTNEIRVSTRTDRAGRAVVEVADTGEGIRPEHLGRIFEPFFTTKPHGFGTGLGLWISRNLVAAAGGELEVESKAGGGSVFRVVLPAAPVAGAEREPAARAEARPPRARVLVVDDDLLVANSIRRALAAEHEVVVETSARAALARVERGESFGAIVCDLMMPEMTGMELHAEVARLSPEAGARVVFVTGGAFTPQARDYLEAVPNPRLEKPFAMQALLGVIRDVVTA